MDMIQNAIAQLSGFDWFIILTNGFLLIFSAPIASRLSGTSADSTRGRMHFMRGLSALLLVVYLASLFTNLGSTLCKADQGPCDPLRRLSLSGLTILISYVIYILSHAWVVRRYGRTREIEGQEVKYHTYQSELLSVLVLLAVILLSFLTVLSIWHVEQWLRSTSVLGGLLVVLFFTKDVWLPDNVNGLILLYNNDVEPGSVVRVRELDLLAVTQRTTLVQTVFRDLVQRHLIVIPNAKFRNQKIEILSNCGGGGLREFVHFNIGYDVPAGTVEEMLTETWRLACEAESAINPNIEPRILLLENGDHAITWRLMYSVRNVYRLPNARFAVQRAAHDVSRSANIGLNTPMTHTLLGESGIDNSLPEQP